ncbi:hypothetical protein EC848_2595 [Enterobacter sp. BIGb0359]|nr:hypothetical protein EC848_2595 [Enterobacter sp. BIGb0359]
MLSALRRCVAHILLSGTYKSNIFSRPLIVCTLHVQLVCKTSKKGDLSVTIRRIHAIYALQKIGSRPGLRTLKEREKRK